MVTVSLEKETAILLNKATSKFLNEYPSEKLKKDKVIKKALKVYLEV